MMRITTLHRLAFARFKHWVPHLPGRDARKRQRDALPATAVQSVVRKYLFQCERDFAPPKIPATAALMSGLTTGDETAG